MEETNIGIVILYLLAHYWYIFLVAFLLFFLIGRWSKKVKKDDDIKQRPGEYECLVNKLIDEEDYSSKNSISNEYENAKIEFRKKEELYKEEYEKLQKEIKLANRKNELGENRIKELEDTCLSLRKEISEIKNIDKVNVIKDVKSFVLSSGKYKGGINIPIGIYDLNVISGSGTFQCNKPEEIYQNISCDKEDVKRYGYIDSYCYLEVNEKTNIKIIGASVRFTLSKQYDFSNEINDLKAEYENEKNRISKEFDVEKFRLNMELKEIKDELKILNNQLIQKYYVFSNYDNITSGDCKNQIILLKCDEKELRESEKDVKIIFDKNNPVYKNKDKYVRILLRTFNAECDNIMLNVKISNIDALRKKIQKSFDTLNKLHYSNGLALSKELLEIKLKQVELMYTYELKYEQEKEIQKAIKEQMMEEARAEKEIQEQKKKIEKDLQQHIGEVNRMMKYLQKAQVDAEKQLYMDKIKELEEKIKTLEANKEEVLEREANAKAGFVYIISNIGSFGENIYKIGMTRRLEPMDRVKELSSASVPFEFDVHAMIFSSDAPELENMLHKHFASKAVNKINPRKEFFNVDIDEIETVVKNNFNDTVQFTKVPLATEYRQSLTM